MDRGTRSQGHHPLCVVGMVARLFSGTWSWSARTRPEPTQGSWVDICADIWVDLWCRPSLLLPTFSPCALGRKKTERAGEREKADAISHFFKSACAPGAESPPHPDFG